MEPKETKLDGALQNALANAKEDDVVSVSVVVKENLSVEDRNALANIEFDITVDAAETMTVLCGHLPTKNLKQLEALDCVLSVDMTQKMHVML